MCAQWTVDEAENRLAKVIKAAELGEPQFIYKAGRKEAVLVSPKTWENIVTPKKSLHSSKRYNPFPRGRHILKKMDGKNLNYGRWNFEIPAGKSVYIHSDGHIYPVDIQ